MVRSIKSHLLAATAVAVVAGAHAHAQTAITTPLLTGANNFRDIAGIAATVNGVSTGGTGYAETTTHDGVMRTGAFYRSNALSTLTASDLTKLAGLGIKLDVDLRTPGEISAAPDIVPAGATYVNVNILGASAASFTLTSAAASVAYMQAANTSFVTSAAERANIRQALLDLASGDGADLYHCSAGKDRAGWISMVLQSIAGVSSSQIMTDYLATNVYSAKSIAATLAALPASYAAAYAPLLGVQSSFLQAGLDQITASYGSMQNYLTQGLGLTQADIYVLRAKMVYFNSLPGQAGFTGNAGAGARLLQNLQNSPLSGAYTPFNYYLQSAIDAGSLGGVQNQIGAPVYADTLSYFLRQPRWIESAVAPYAVGADLDIGKLVLWQTNVAGYLNVRANGGDASVDERAIAPLFGATYRAAVNASLFAGVGYSWGGVSSAGATARANDFLFTFGGRYGATGLDAGWFVNAQGDIGAIDARANRTLNAGLGTASGDTTGMLASGRVDLGYIWHDGPLSYTPQVGVRVAHANIDGFSETGSSLALGIDGSSKTLASLVTGLGVSAKALELFGGWTASPDAALNWEHALNSPVVATTGNLLGYSIAQASTFRARDLFSLDLGLSMNQSQNLRLHAGVNLVADTSGDLGVGGKFTAEYRF